MNLVIGSGIATASKASLLGSLPLIAVADNPAVSQKTVATPGDGCPSAFPFVASIRPVDPPVGLFASRQGGGAACEMPDGPE